MAGNFPPVPHQSQVTGADGLLTPAWADWFNRLFGRSSGAYSIGSSGYVKLPGGLMIQWGVTGSVVSGATESVTFPAVFPTACLHVTPSPKSNSGVATAATGQVGSGNYSATGADLYNRTSVTLTLNWIALGH